MLIVDLNVARVVQHSPFPVLYLAYTQVISQIDCAVSVRMSTTTITLRVQNLTLSSLKLSPPWPTTHIYIDIYTYMRDVPRGYLLIVSGINR